MVAAMSPSLFFWLFDWGITVTRSAGCESSGAQS